MDAPPVFSVEPSRVGLKEALEGDRLLLDKARWRQRARAHYFDYRGDRRGGGPGDRRADLAANLDRIISAHEFAATQAPIGPALGGHMNKDDVLVDRGLGVGKDLPGRGAILAHQELVEKEIHQRGMARIAQALVVQVLDPIGE